MRSTPPFGTLSLVDRSGRNYRAIGIQDDPCQTAGMCLAAGASNGLKLVDLLVIFDCELLEVGWQAGINRY